jgi:SAM-dependent methyltransferase
LPADSDLFNAYYFATGCGSTPYATTGPMRAFFDTVATRIQADIRPGTVLDAGCAMGVLVHALRDLGVAAFGVDVSAYAIGQAQDAVQPFLQMASLTEPLAQRYDLITCIEVLEHMEKAAAEQAIAQLCAATHDILFSSTPFDYAEATHFNVQLPEYWVEQFARHGFYRDLDFDASFITDWAVRFRRRDLPPHRLAKEYERRFWQLQKENQDLRRAAVEMRRDLAALNERAATLERHTQAQVEQAESHRRQLEAVVRSPGWRAVETVHRLRKRLAPTGSRRDRWLHRVAGRWLTS